MHFPNLTKLYATIISNVLYNLLFSWLYFKVQSKFVCKTIFMQSVAVVINSVSDSQIAALSKFYRIIKVILVIRLLHNHITNGCRLCTCTCILSDFLFLFISTQFIMSNTYSASGLSYTS